MGMKVYLNGRFVSAERARVSVFDRGFLYGDGLFEAIRIHRGRPFRWAEHIERFEQGAALLGIKVPLPARGKTSSLAHAATRLIEMNRFREGVMRLTLSRGASERGYSILKAQQPTLVISIHPFTGGKPMGAWRLATVPDLSPGKRLAQVKSANKLPQIFALTQAQAQGADDALMVDAHGFVTEAASANVFWVKNERIFTTPLSAAILPGITRSVIVEICRAIGAKVMEQRITPKALRKTDGVFLTLSSRGVVPVSSIDNQHLRQSPLIKQIRDAYERVLKRESRCAAWE